MKDISVFPTQYGVASLILKEVPYRAIAYIRVQSSTPDNLPLLIRECAGFCRACGAEKIYWSAEDATGEPDVTVVEMRGTALVDKEKIASVFPVTEQTVSRWRQIYNERMFHVDNATTLEARDEKKLLSSVGACFIHKDGELPGIGWLEDTELRAIAAVIPGAGEQVAHTLMSLVEGSIVTLQVASTNQKAIRLYERLGFLQTRPLRKWYLVKDFD